MGEFRRDQKLSSPLRLPKAITCGAVYEGGHIIDPREGKVCSALSQILARAAFVGLGATPRKS
jgi:hypothetical protein